MMKEVGFVLVFACLVVKAYATGLHTCKPPPLPKNGLVKGALKPSYNIGGYVEFLCNPGFQLQGDSLTVCIDTQEGGVWNKPTPLCVRKSTSACSLYSYTLHLFSVHFTVLACIWSVI